MVAVEESQGTASAAQPAFMQPASAQPTLAEALAAGPVVLDGGLSNQLEAQGERDFVVFERDSEIGGTWAANTYPGCQCDVPAKLYSFSFALNPELSNTYSDRG